MKVIICGAGQVGFNLARYLASRHHVTVIDNSPELIARINDRLDVKAILGYASHPEVLEKAGAASCDMVVAVTRSDEVNMMACQIVDVLFKVKTKIARIRNQSYLHPAWSHLFEKGSLGIDVVISPEIEVARAISRSLTVPGAFDIIPLAYGLVKIIGVRCTSETPLINTPISHINSLFKDLDITILGLARDDRRFIPVETDIIKAGDEVYFAVDSDQVRHALEAFGFEGAESRRLLILGGGNIGLSLAQLVEEQLPTVDVHLIESDERRAELIAQKLTRGVVLCGDALDSEVLMESTVETAETVVAVTADDRVNILASLLAKRHGAARALALVNDTSYSPLVTSLGVDAVISPRVVTVSSILQHIKSGQINSVYSLGENFGEIIEAEALGNSSLIGKSVGDINIKQELLVAAVVRAGKVIIPSENTVIQLEDKVIIMISTHMIPKIEKLFSARLDYI
jgi:trk system potassium uptake protein TrkA